MSFSRSIIGSRLILAALVIGTCPYGIPFLSSSSLHAQTENGATDESTTNFVTATGVAGKDDKYVRNPVLNVSTVVRGEGETQTASILADASQRQPSYRDYPVQFDFYVNRKLFATQYRSNTLPGPVGIDVGPDVATLPFNYTVVAKLITPDGRIFSTVIEGAVFASQLTGTLDCTVTVAGASTTDYVANAVSVSQTGNSSFELNIEKAEAITTSDFISTKLTATVTEGTGTEGSSATGSLELTTNGDEASTRTVEIGGTLTQESNKISSLTLSASDNSVTVRCS